MDKEGKGSRKLKKLTSVISSLEEDVEKRGYPEWVIDIKQFIKQKQVYQSGKLWTIYEVPASLKNVQKNAFIPKIISIGPFHYQKDTMQDHKKRHLLRLLGGKLGEVKGATSAEDSPHRDVHIEKLFEAMKELEPETRERYSKSFHDHDQHGITSDDFVNMMVMDGCFVIELLRLYHKSQDNKDNADRKNDITDPIFTTPWMLTTLRRDLIMLENQLPFKVLKKLFNLTKLDNEPSLEELAVTFLDPLLPRKDFNKVIDQIDYGKDYQHLLDLFRFTFISTIRGNNDASQNQEKAELNMHCASDLRDAGFEVEKGEEGELININFIKGNLFRKGTLQMPQLIIDDDSLPLFLNFVAYEQSHDKASSYFTNYFMFVDSLINTSKDVETLRECEVLYHEMGSDTKVFDLIIDLCREIIYDSRRCHLSTQMKGMNDYWNDRHKYRWLAGWRKFWNKSDKWIVLSVVAAVLLLLLTGMQTAYTLFSYYEPTEGMALRVSSS